MNAGVPHLRAQRLDLTPLRAADAAIVFADARDPVLYRYLQQRPPESPEALRRLFERWSAGSPSGDEVWLNWLGIERVTDQRVGLFQVTLDMLGNAATIAYTIFARFSGNGFARDGAAAIIEYLGQRGVARIVAEISEPNAASRGVVEPLGFALRSRIAGSGREDGRVCDDVVYERELQPPTSHRPR